MAKTKRSLGQRVAAVVAVLLVLAVVGLGSAWATGWAITGEVNPSNWKNTAEATEPRTVAVTNDGQALTNGCTYDMPAGFTFLSARSVSSETLEYVAGGEITLTAELSNEYINGKFDWSADFANSSSAWAQGKVASYYVGLEPIDGGRQVKLNYLAPFSEQIILTATLQGTESSASCTIDCLFRIKSVQPSTGWHFTDYVCLGVTPKYVDNGTVKGELTFHSIYASIDESFQNKVKSFLNFDIDFKGYYANSFDNSVYDSDENGFYLDTNVEITPTLFIKNYETYDEEHQNAICYAWYAANKATNNSNNATYDFAVDYNYNGQFVEKLEESEIGCCVNAIQYRDLAPSVTLNKNYAF